MPSRYDPDAVMASPREGLTPLVGPLAVPNTWSLGRVCGLRAVSAIVPAYIAYPPGT
jgi:hypothetical protein